MVRRAHLPSLQVCQDLAQQRRRDPERPLEPFRLKWNRSRHFAGSWTRGAKMRQKSNSNTLSSEEIRQKASAEQPGSATRPRRRTTTHRTRARRGLRTQRRCAFHCSGNYRCCRWRQAYVAIGGNPCISKSRFNASAISFYCDTFLRSDRRWAASTSAALFACLLPLGCPSYPDRRSGEPNKDRPHIGRLRLGPARGRTSSSGVMAQPVSTASRQVFKSANEGCNRPYKGNEG